MFDWLFEGRPIVYASLGVIGLALLVLWWQSRKRGLLIAAGVVALLTVVVALLDRARETDREQIQHRVEDLAASLTSRNVEQAFTNLSDQFRTPRGLDKKGLKDLAKMYIDGGTISSVEVWEIRVLSISPEEGKARVSFRVKVKPVQELDLRCDSVFDRDPVHGWRLREYRLFKPFVDEEWPSPI